MPQFDNAHRLGPSASYRPPTGARGKWARSTPESGNPEPWEIECYCCRNKTGKKKLLTYEEYQYGGWCTEHRKMFDRYPKRRDRELYSGSAYPRKIIFADGYGILHKGKFIELKIIGADR